MAVAPPTPRDLDSYREQADRFIAAIDEEYYLHYAGHKDTLDLAPIYERYADLTSLEQANRIGASVNGDRRIRELWRFACQGHLGSLTRELAERAARLEAELTASVDGEEIPYRMLRPTMANEPDRDRRQRLEQARNELTEEHLVPLQLEASHIERRAVEQLGAPNYVELHRRFGFRLDELGEQARAFLDSTEGRWEDAGDRLFRSRVGVGLAEAQRFDVARMFRAPQWDPSFPGDQMLPALEGTLADLGVDLRAQKNVELDVEQREKKSPRAFCAPIEVPQRVVLVIQPVGGVDDWRALFHEAGHTEHFAHTRADLAVEERRLGDYAVTEGWAMLMEHLVQDSAWLNRRLDVPRPTEFVAESATGLLYLVRRYCAKILYELELHQADDPLPLRKRYVEILGDALKIEPSDTDYLADVDAGFYCTEYVRAWAFEAALKRFFREKFGRTWFTRRDAGSLIRELWSEGQRMTADEILKELTSAEIELEAVTEYVDESLAAA
jgi:oligoendopeptidase F